MINYKKSFIGSVIAFIVATSCCWMPALIIALGGGTALIGISEGIGKFSGLFILLGLVLLGLGMYKFKTERGKSKKKEVVLNSVIKCPKCGFKKEERMPENACQYFYECTNCSFLIKPKDQDCCVYCSYGTVTCPPIQSNQNCC